MKKLMFLFLLGFLSMHVFAQNVSISPKKLTNDTVVWKKDSLLKFDEFKSKTKMHNAEGYACTGILFYPKEDNGEMNFYVEAIFIKSKSMMSDNSAYGIKHEQLHFDITELYALKLRQAISQIDFKKVKNIVEVMNNLYARYSNQLNSEQNKYDNDTQHGLNPAKQQVWEDDIKQQLEALKDFSSTEIDVTK